MSAAPQLAPRVRELLVKLLWLTDNANDHERAIAAAKFMALLKQHNLTPADVLAPQAINQVVQIVHPSAPAYPPPQPPPPRDWHRVVQDILTTRSNALYPKEQVFLPDLLRKGYAPRSRRGTRSPGTPRPVTRQRGTM